MAEKKKAKYANNPLVRYVRSLPEPYYLAHEVAEQLDCGLRYLEDIRLLSDPPLGPTHHAYYGSIKLRLYTPQRVEEIAAFIEQRRGERRTRGPVRLWTRTETQNRQRQFHRASRYRARAAEKRAAGDTTEAERLEKLDKEVIELLEKQRKQRWEKVHRRKLPAGKHGIGGARSTTRSS